MSAREHTKARLEAIAALSVAAALAQTRDEAREASMTEMLSDAEREAIIRERLRLHPRPRCQCDACVLSRRLDEARTSAAPPAESLSQRVERERPRSRWLDNLGKERVARIEELRAGVEPHARP